MPFPPELSDCPLDATIALAAVREQVPALACQHAEPLGDNWSVEHYLVDDRFAVRFPRRAKRAQRVDHDEAVLTLVGAHLLSAFAVPTIVARGRAGTHFPYDFLVCEFVRGVTARSATAPQSAELAAELGRALTRIHSVPVADARAAGVGDADWDNAGYEGPVRFIHGDFRDSHFIVHPTSGRLVGIIEWGSAGVGDPAIDFMLLVLTRGWDFTHRVLAAYGMPMDDHFLDRVRHHAHLLWLQSGMSPPLTQP